MPKVQIDGQDDPVEVSSDAIQWGEDESPDGYVPREKMQSEIQRRVSSAKENAKDKARETLREDDEFTRSIVTDRFGIELDEDGNPQLEDGADPEKIAQRIEQEKVKPLQSKIEEKDETISTLRARDRRRAIMEAAQEAGVKPHLLKAPSEGADPLIVQMTKDNFAFDPEHDMWAETEGEDFRYSSSPKEGAPFAGPVEFFKRLKKSGEYEEFFTDDRPEGTGLGNTGASEDGETITVKREEVRGDHARYRELRQKAESEGKRLVIED